MILRPDIARFRPPRGLVLAVVLAALGAGGPARLDAQHPLVTLPLDDPAYLQLGGLERLGCAAARVSPYRPYTSGAVRAALDTAAADARCTGLLLDALRARFASPDSAAGVSAGAAVTLRGTALGKGEFRPLWDSVRATSAGDPPGVAIVRGRATWSGGPRVVGVAEMYAQTGRRNDPTVRGRALRRTSGVVDFADAYLSGQLGPLTLSFGRAEEAWLGDGRESLVLSAQGPAYDRLLASLRWRSLEGRAVVAQLNTIILDTLRDGLPSGTPDQRFYRYLIGHALTWTPSRSVEVSLGETALLSRGSRTLDLAYANPLMLYVVTQNDSSARESNRDNLSLFGAVRSHLGVATLTGELLIDDVQIDAADRKRIPDQLAWRLEATARLPLYWAATGSAEYRRVDNYTYMRGFYTEVYQQYDRPLGSELGPAADLARVGLELFPVGTLRLAGRIGIWRRGALRIDQRPSVRAEGHAGEPFPTVTPERPAVQRALLGDVSVQFLNAALPLTLRVETARIDNANNQPVTAALYVRAQLVGTYAFRYP